MRYSHCLVLFPNSAIAATTAAALLLQSAAALAPTNTQAAGPAQAGPAPIFLPAVLRAGRLLAAATVTPEPATATPTTAPSPAPTATAAGPGRLLLNEVRFKPASGQAPFVELTNAGPGPAALEAIALTNALTETFRLPDGLAPLAPGALLVVLFDGQNRVDGRTVHADRQAFLDPQSDALSLAAGQGQASLDRVAWGRRQRDPVPLGPGGFVPALVAGATIGRYPGATERGSAGWVRYAVEDATPGGPNPAPAVEAFPMIDGLITDQPVVTLQWYAVPGAATYHLQLGTDATFASPMADTTVVSATFTTPRLAPGDYLWRVAAIGQTGAASRYSAPLHLTVEAASPVSAARGAAGGEGIGTTGGGKYALASSKSLDVPLIKQHKDTAMLLLESTTETGPHAWDLAHPDLDTHDPADNMNCGLATAAMIAAYYGGKTSQDRLGYELRHDEQPGPEDDLLYGSGISDDEMLTLVRFAVGAGASGYGWLGDPGERHAFWESVKLAIDAGKPVAMCGGHHCVAIYGYKDGLLSHQLLVNDPWTGKSRLNADLAPVSVYVFPPGNAAGRNDEQTISADSDGDGMVDFDETERFHTDPEQTDSDQDKISDKDDVRLANFDPDHGYAFFGDARNDIDGDGKPPELDDDADNGGCIDGLEDLNQNGKVDKGLNETSPFEKRDDKCIFGTYVMHNDKTTPIGNGDGLSHSWEDERARFSLKPVADGKLEGQGAYSYRAGAHEEYYGPNHPCRVVDEPTTGPSWTSNLTGTWQDNLVLVNPSGPSPGWTVRAIGCGVTGTSAAPPMRWPGAGGELVDGVYDKRLDFPPTPPTTGEFYIIIHMEQFHDAGNSDARHGARERQSRESPP